MNGQQRVIVNGAGAKDSNGSALSSHSVSYAAVGAPHAPRASRTRYDGGWRAGKPAEDPEKLKRWGRITARPSEFLVHMRRGKVLPGSSGQGASCFKLPGDAVAVVPTTVQKLQFQAEQVTREKVGIEVTGLAVYRIADPLIAFRMLNFSFPERAQEKLEELLVEMFVGAVRRLVANLGVEECLTRRKEGLAEELMREIQPVVSGHGRVDDATDKGWGIVLDTIEIQDVRILSETVFSHMQAGYRQEQERRAREAELVTARAVKLGQAETEREIELKHLAAKGEVEQRRRAAEEQARLGEIAAGARVAEARVAQQRAAQHAEVQAAQEVALAKLEADLELKRRRQTAEEQAKLEALSAEARLDEARLACDQRSLSLRMATELERVRLDAESAAARHAAEVERVRHEIERCRLSAELAAARRELAEAELGIAELETRRAMLAQQLELERARSLRQIENLVSREVIELAVAQKLPELAAAFQQNMGQIHVTAVDGANPFGFVAAAVEGVLGMARSAGLSIPAVNRSAT
ncbi:MAG: hypothetical protein IT372_29400 [Polyangiaceae bacterium]|nr:hypothetical protein [Polyangiaceae bacterium]